MKALIVPFMLLCSSLLMALAWLGHIRFRHKGFRIALLASWILVLPEYLLNVSAIRYGHGFYSGSEMAAFNLCSGVFCVALVARFFLGERLGKRQILGFVLMAAAVVLVMTPLTSEERKEDRRLRPPAKTTSAPETPPSPKKAPKKAPPSSETSTQGD